MMKTLKVASWLTITNSLSIFENNAIMFVIGTEMDFIKEEFGERFVFNNPNQTSECGCGESFHV